MFHVPGLTQVDTKKTYFPKVFTFSRIKKFEPESDSGSNIDTHRTYFSVDPKIIAYDM